MDNKLKQDTKKTLNKPETTKGEAWFKPDTDIYETDKNMVLLFDIPGCDKDSIDINIDNDILTVNGYIKKYIPDSTKIISREYYDGNYKRQFSLPDYLNTEKINAKYKNGVLKLIIEKREEVQPKQVQISVE